jgi:hypothetical protein
VDANGEWGIAYSLKKRISVFFIRRLSTPEGLNPNKKNISRKITTPEGLNKDALICNLIKWLCLKTLLRQGCVRFSSFPEAEARFA